MVALRRRDARQRTGLKVMERMSDLIKRGDPITSITTTELYGGTSSPLFDIGMERPLMSFSMLGNYHPILDFIGWTPSLFHRVHKGFISYAAADGAAASSPTAGAVADPCDPGNTIEFGKCDYLLDGYGRVRRKTPNRTDDEDGLMYNDTIDLHRLNGTPITNEKEFDMFLTTSVIVQDLHRYLITGNKSTGGEFDGFEQLITYGYLDSGGASCSAMDSYVIDWAGLDMSNAVSDVNGTQIKINNVAVVDGTYNIYAMLEWVMRNIRIRLKFAPILQNRLNLGEVVLMMPTSWIKPFLNVVTCYAHCGGDFAQMTTPFAQEFIRNLWSDGEDNALEDAQVTIEGIPVIITGYDYELDNGDGTADWYLLVKGNSGVPFMYGEYKDNAPTISGDRQGRYATTDGNMLLTWSTYDETCSYRVVQMQPRLQMPAPWAQVRIQNVPYEGVLTPQSSDPLSSNYISNLIKSGYS